MINSVQAIARALDNTLAHYCGVGYTHVCSTFTSAEDKGLKFMEYVRGITFEIEDMLPPNTFSFSGNSAQIPFELFSFNNGVYMKVL